VSNPKHKGPHCDGYCEGVAYTLMIRDKDAEIEELKIVAGVRLGGMTALQAEIERLNAASEELTTLWSIALQGKDAEIERLNAHLATVQKQADDMVAKHSVLTDNVIACNSVINDNARARQRLESVIDEYKKEVVFLRGQLEA